MAKKRQVELGTSLKANLARKGKKSVPNIEEAASLEKTPEKLLKSPRTTQELPKEEPTPVIYKRTTIYIPVDLHKDIKRFCLEHDIESVSRYLIGLAQKDMKKKI